jgi:hypothetical protein
VDRVLGGRVGDEDDRNRIAGLAGVLRAGFVALHNRLSEICRCASRRAMVAALPGRSRAISRM